jgi:hypothetical protein
VSTYFYLVRRKILFLVKHFLLLRGCCLHRRNATAIITTPPYTLRLELHQSHLPSPLLLANASTLPSPHRRLAVLYCRCHPQQPLSNTLFIAAASPPPHRCLSPPLSNAIVILHCHRCCCHPSPPSNPDSRLLDVQVRTLLMAGSALWDECTEQVH